MKRVRVGLGLSTAALLAGCSLDPTYHRPKSPVPGLYPNAHASSQRTVGADHDRPSASIGWRQFFSSDPVLRQLIALALTNNRDLRVSTLDVLAARAEFREARGSLFPTLDAQGGFTESRSPSDIYSYGGDSSSTSALGVLSTTGAPESTGAGGGLSTAGETVKEWSLGLGVSSYEVDLFGQVRSQSREAFETALADEETRRSAEISLISQVADAYLTLIADRESLQVSQQTFDSQRHTLDLEKLTVEKGTGTAQTVAQEETSVDSAAASIAQYNRQVPQDEDALRLLLGAAPPPTLQAALDRQTTLENRHPLPEVAAGLPSDLILRRPDIRSAEHTLLAANASIGAARANFFPELTLTASGGTASSELNNLFRAGQGNWSFSPSVTLPIFDWGINAAKLDYARTQKKIDVADYDKAIQTAFREVSDALAAQGTYRQQVEAERALVAADQRYYELSLLRFHAGVDTYLSALDAQRSVFSAELNLISVHSSQLQSQVTLYEDLGGGWQNGSETPASDTNPG